MPIDAALMLFLAVMLYARIGLGRAVPLAAVLVASATWGLLLVAQLVAQLFGAVTRLGGLDPSSYYAPTSALVEFSTLTATAIWLLFGLGAIASVILAFVMTPLPEPQKT